MGYNWNIYQEDEINKIKKACQISASLLAEIGGINWVGRKTIEVDQLAEQFILDHGAQPAFKGYMGYEFTICASINDEIVHGLPSERVLLEGDILTVDLGSCVEGYYSDTARTFAIGEVSQERQNLIDIAKRSFEKGLEKLKVGERLYTVSARIQEEIEQAGYFVVKDYVGHGIGKSLHEDPQIPNYGKKDTGPKLEVGMVVAIEPMVLAKDETTKVKSDGWTVVSSRGCDSSHYENTVVILEEGTEVLTEL